MDTRELQEGIKGKLGRRVKYVGIYTWDKLPRMFVDGYKPIVFIANTLKSSADINVVGHWVAFFVERTSPQKYKIVFFDSYGLSPKLYGNISFSRFVKHYESHIIYEFGRQVQPDTSLKCGLYVLLFIHYVSYFGLERFIQHYHNVFTKKHLPSNDAYVTRYYFKYLNRAKCARWKIGSKRAITYKECKILITGN